MASAVEVLKFTDAREFLSRVRLSADTWWDADSARSDWVFRGVGDADCWTLVPSAWRTGNTNFDRLCEHVRSQVLPLSDNTAPTPALREYLECRAAEQEAVHVFAQLARSLGFKIEGHTQSPLDIRLLIHESLGFGQVGSHDLFALAQHHGIPTRLLDWSLDPIVATFFAASPPFRRNEDSSICLWALNTSRLQVAQAKLTTGTAPRVHVYYPERSTNAYLHSQSGVMTELAPAKSFYVENRRWPSVEEAVSVLASDRQILVGHRLSHDQVPLLLRLLSREGVNRAQLMPSLDNVAQTAMESLARPR